MFGLILPPIIIVVSLSILIFVFSTKIRNLSEKEKRMIKSDQTEWNSKINSLFGYDKIVSLNFPEKIVQRFKIFFLRAHNMFDKWSRSLKRKKERNENVNRLEKLKSVKNFIKKSRNVLATKSNKKRFKKIRVSRKNEFQVKKSKKRPMVSKELVTPQSWMNQKKEKNKLEEILIERIAFNPRDIEAYEKLGDYYKEQRNWKDALECFKQVLKLSPVNHKAKVQTERIKRILGE